ncbi:MAG: sigma-54 dependent transcriptional regulator [Pyrinomonadaceae bacterium]|nr:sigma-54 dependent transcriptional regulator [Pyrinomonadaceae bacterium]
MPPSIAQPQCGAVLLVAPQKESCQKVELALSHRGHSVAWCANALEALNYSAQREFDLILVDSRLQAATVDLVGQIKARGTNEEIVIAAFNGSGSDDKPQLREPYLANPFQLDGLIRSIEGALRRRDLLRGIVNGKVGTEADPGNTRVQSAPNTRSRLPMTTALIGRTPVMKQLFRTIQRIAPIDSNVLITGATGTGKELVARAIHDGSGRRDGPFVDVNSSAIPDTLFETEFFGHQRGTFTGAYETRRGLFEKASGGTLFLDEVDTLNLSAQAKLLRVLQERHLRRLGGRENISVDVRIIAATSTNLKGATASGAFRPDLYFRLRVVPLHVPQLRERVEDVELLVDHFLRHHAERNGHQPRRFSPEAIRAMSDYSWPGNVRELENAIEYALAIGSGEELGIDDLPADMFGEDVEEIDDANVLTFPSNASLAEVERRHILAVFNRCGRHHIKTAAALRIDRRTLYRKLQQYNLDLQINSA